MSQYLDLVRAIYDNGRVKTDRTGVGTVSIFGHQMRFNLAEGFPVVTEKFTFLRGVIHELLWMIKGDTNIQYLLDNNVHIWDEWAITEGHTRLSHQQRMTLSQQSKFNSSQLALYTATAIATRGIEKEDAEKEWLDRNNFARFNGSFRAGDLGPVYSAPWRRSPVNDGKLIFVERRMGPARGPVEYPSNYGSPNQIPSEYTGDFGQVHFNEDVPFRIIREFESPDKNSHYLIQFDETGPTMIVSRPITGACKGHGPAANPRIYALWRNMVERCHNPENPNYRHYGGKGVYVSPRWLCFENFEKDLSRLPNYEDWTLNPNRYDLDKDYFGANCYDVSTCVFLPKKFNTSLDSRYYVEAVSPDGEVTHHTSKSAFCSHVGISEETLRNFENGAVGNPIKLNGWAFKEIEVPEGKLARPRIIIDQLADAVNLLKTKPTSRRIIVSSWLPNLLPDESISPTDNVLCGQQALPPCHTFFQFMAEPLTLAERMKCDGTLLPCFPGDGGHLEAILREQGYHAYVDEIITSFTEQDIADVTNKLDALNTPKYRLSCQLYQRKRDCALAA